MQNATKINSSSVIQKKNTGNLLNCQQSCSIFENTPCGRFPTSAVEPGKHVQRSLPLEIFIRGTTWYGLRSHQNQTYIIWRIHIYKTVAAAMASSVIWNERSATSFFLCFSGHRSSSKRDLRDSKTQAICQVQVSISQFNRFMFFWPLILSHDRDNVSYWAICSRSKWRRAIG